jgi:hypothetical protein
MVPVLTLVMLLGILYLVVLSPFVIYDAIRGELLKCERCKAEVGPSERNPKISPLRGVIATLQDESCKKLREDRP